MHGNRIFLGLLERQGLCAMAVHRESSGFVTCSPLPGLSRQSYIPEEALEALAYMILGRYSPEHYDTSVL